MPDSPKSYRLTRELRLRGKNAFKKVFEARMRKSAGPITVLSAPNGLPHPRFGISIGVRAGNAVCRNRVKRLLREAFRLCRHDWPRGYDVVVLVHRHPIATLAEYQRLLFSAMRSSHLEWQRRERKAGEAGPSVPQGRP